MRVGWDLAAISVDGVAVGKVEWVLVDAVVGSNKFAVLLRVEVTAETENTVAGELGGLEEDDLSVEPDVDEETWDVDEVPGLAVDNLLNGEKDCIGMFGVPEHEFLVVSNILLSSINTNDHWRGFIDRQDFNLVLAEESLESLVVSAVLDVLVEDAESVLFSGILGH